MEATTQLDLDDMIAHPEKYGFAWAYGPVSKRTDKASNTKVVVCPRAPYIDYQDLDLCVKTFGANHFLDMANGTSGRVRDQEAVREPCAKDLKLRNNILELQRLVLERALNQRVTRRATVIVEKEVRKFFDIGGNEWPTQAEAMAASIDIMQAKQQA